MNFVLKPPLIAFIVATRAMIAAGVGLLAADHIPPEQRRAVGITLIAIGAASTIPAAIGLIRSRVSSSAPPLSAQAPGIA